MEDLVIPKKIKVHWGKVFQIAQKSLKKRAMRASITMLSVVLSIAFLTYSWLCSDFIEGLKLLDNKEVNSLLLRSGVDFGVEGMSGKTKWLTMLSLLVSSVGILNAMLMSVTERFKEIGTMKCLGATNGFIIRLFIIEASIQGFTGAFVGVLGGAIIATLQSTFSYGSIALSSLDMTNALKSTGLGLFIGVGLTVLFALFPAVIAARKLPVEAMRVEE